jgi:multidrug efflux pump subunit AcrA (membrane-fusion protein)
VARAVPDLPSRLAAHAAGDGRDFTTDGPLVVEQQADVVSERDGRVTAVSVEIGDHVRRGEVLALLDDRALQAARAEKAARIDSLRAQVQEWEAEQKSNEADLRRAGAMRSEKILSEEDWEHVRYKLTETVAQVARYKADGLASESELHAADVELGQSRITAPFDGVVGRRSAHQAQEVKKGDSCSMPWLPALTATCCYGCSSASVTTSSTTGSPSSRWSRRRCWHSSSFAPGCAGCKTSFWASSGPRQARGLSDSRLCALCLRPPYSPFSFCPSCASA